MALFRTVMIGLICAGFTTASYCETPMAEGGSTRRTTTRNSDGTTTVKTELTGSYGGKGSASQSNPCAGQRDGTPCEKNGASKAECKNEVCRAITCKKEFAFVVRDNSRDRTREKLVPQYWCVHKEFWCPQVRPDECGTGPGKRQCTLQTIDYNGQEATIQDMYDIDPDKTYSKKGFYTCDFTDELNFPKEKEYRISYELYDGTHCPNADGRPETYKAGLGAKIDCEPTKEDYYFGGWYRTDVTNDNASNPYIIGKEEHQDITLHAKWAQEQPKEFDIIYNWHWDEDKPGVECPDENKPEQYTAGNAFTINCIPTRPDYKFRGWCVGQDADGCENPTMTVDITATDTGTKYLHAQWVLDTWAGKVNCTEYSNCVDVDIFQKLDVELKNNFAEGSSSKWKNEEGKFNTARLASDSVASVVLGTVGGVITSTVMKKAQVKKGFEDLRCVVNGQNVASYGDQFWVGMLQAQ